MKNQHSAVVFVLALGSALLIVMGLFFFGDIRSGAAHPLDTGGAGPALTFTGLAERLHSALSWVQVAESPLTQAAPPPVDRTAISGPFQAQADLVLEKWTTPGYARPGGVVNYGLYYRNYGVVAENTVITDTLPEYTTYAGDNSGFPYTIADNQIIWNVGNVEPHTGFEFIVTLNVDADVLPDMPLEANCATISTSTPEEILDNNTDCTSEPVSVLEDDVDMGVMVQVRPHDPTPGHEFIYDIQVCNHRGTAAGPIWLTSTLPIHTSVVDWYHDHPHKVGWQEIPEAAEGALVFTTAGFPGTLCDSLHLRLRLDDDAPLETRLEHHVALAVAEDVQPDDNEFLNEEAVVGPPRYDVGIDKQFLQGVLTPGGWIRYRVNFWNNGNVAHPLWITDTLPAALSYIPESAYSHDGQPFPPIDIVGSDVVWEVSEIAVQSGFGFDFDAGISASLVEPGDWVYNCIHVEGPEPDAHPSDNTSCFWNQIFEAGGPNLAVEKEHWWHKDGQLGYIIHFYNLGDISSAEVWITDTLPADTQWDGWWGMHFDWSRLEQEPLSSDVLVWQLSYLAPGEYGTLEFAVNLNEPGAPLRWYTNTVEIASPYSDINPDNNIYHEIAFSGGEVQWVDFKVGEAHVWGCAYATPVTVTTASAEKVFWDTCWDEWDFPDTFDPGDTITVTAGAGLQPVIAHVPLPFTAETSSSDNTVWGQVGVSYEAIEVYLSGFGSHWTTSDGDGYYSVTFDDMPRNAEGEVNYHAEIDYAHVVFRRRFQMPAPQLTASFDQSALRIPVNGSVSFTDTSTSDASEIVAWQWDFGDGETSAVQHPTHTYTQTGEFTVTLVITDDLGYSDSAWSHISVVVVPLRVWRVVPNYGFNDTTTPITITGRLFADGATVALVRGDIVEPLTSTYVDANTLHATVPAGLLPGTYGVRVANPAPDGQRDTLLSGFTVLSPAPPQILSVSPNQGWKDAAVVLDIYGSNFAPGFYAELSGARTAVLQGLYFISSNHIRAVVPVHIDAGLYTLRVFNPDAQYHELPDAYTALESVDLVLPRAGSFWLDPLMLRAGQPVTPTMGIAVRRSGMSGSPTIPSVPVHFFYQAGSGPLVEIGQTSTPPLAPLSQTLTLPMEWLDLPAAGTYTLHAILDPDGTLPQVPAAYNTITRTVIILPPLADTIPPIVESLRINDGEQHTDHPQVYLSAVAQDNAGGSGVTHLLYVEYVFVESAGYWVPIASSGWLPYTEASHAYPWTLHPVPGVHYIRAWAADAAGNISERSRSRFINLLPSSTPAPIAADEAHTYRVRMTAGEVLTYQLTTVEGDADIYVWGPDWRPDDAPLVFSDLVQPVEVVSFTASVDGVYQVEVYGYEQGSYTLEIVETGARQITSIYGVQQNKGRGLPTSDPGLSPESDEEVFGVPSAPTDQTEAHIIYLPLILRDFSTL